MTVRIGIDARYLGFPGIGRYTANLLDGLAARSEDVVVIAYHLAGQSLPRGVSESRIVDHAPFDQRMQLEWRGILSRDRIALFHAPHYEIPLLAPCPIVATIHDMVYFRYPPTGVRGVGKRGYYWLMHQAAARRSRAIITVSEFSKTELLHWLPIQADRITVIPNAVMARPGAGKTHPDQAMRGRLNLPERYALYVGTNKPWKNLTTLLAATKMARDRVGDFSLVMGGKQGRNEEPMPELLRRLGDHGARWLGEIAQDDMPALYAGAEMVLCPSTYEGFGLSGLEAMAFGAPVIASDAPPLPEVLGDAARFVPPRSARAWADAMIDLWTRPEIGERLGGLGTARAALFTLERMASSTLRVYRQVLDPVGQT